MFRRPTLRHLAIGLPIVLAATSLPIVRPAERPAVRHWSIRAASHAKAPGDFGLIGVSWPAGSDPVSAVRVRTSRDGVRWTSWQALDFDIDDVPARDETGQRIISTKPLWVGRARFSDVRFSPARPPGAEVHVVDPGTDPAPPLASAEASVGRPGIITRAQWGADESIRRAPPVYAEPIRMAVIHHTVSSNTYSPSESKAIIRGIYAYHVQTNGWADIGYNALVDRYGQIFEGRAGGIDRGVVGAHAAGFNSRTFGVAMIGTFGSAAPPSAAMDALRRIVAWRLDLANIDPKGTNTYVSGGSNKYPAGQSVRLDNITAHRNVGQTECPGNAFYSTLPALRDAVAGFGNPKLYSPVLSRSTITPNDDGVADSVRLTGRFSSTVSWTVEVVDYNNAVVFSSGGVGTSINVSWLGRNLAGDAVPPDVYRFRIRANNGTATVRTVEIPITVWRYPDGTLFDPVDSPQVFVLSDGSLRHVASYPALLSRFKPAEMILVGGQVRSLYPIGSPIGFREGTLARVGQQYWVISEARRRAASAASLRGLGYDLASAINTSTAALAPHAAGPELTGADPYPNGAALRSTDGRAAWLTDGVAHPFVSRPTRDSYQIRDVDLVGPADQEVNTGAGSTPVGFRDGTLVRTTADPAVYVIADGLRRHISSGRAFTQMNYKWSNLRVVTEAELALHAEGPPI